MRKPRLTKHERKMFYEIINHLNRDFSESDIAYYSKAELKALDSLLEKMFDVFDID